MPKPNEPVQSGGTINENEPVQSTPAINEPQVNSVGDIPENPPGAIINQEQDPVFIALQKEKKRTKRLRRLLTLNKNRSTVVADSTSPGTETVPGTGDEGNPAPVLETSGGTKKRDPLNAALNFLGKGNKKRDGP